MLLYLKELPTYDGEDAVVDLNLNEHQPLVKDIEKYLDVPIWIVFRGFDGSIRLYSFTNRYEAARLVVRTPIYRLTLIIGGRKYDFPPRQEVNRSSLMKHFMQCIDLEAAFYNTPTCVEWVDDIHERRRAWVVPESEDIIRFKKRVDKENP